MVEDVDFELLDEDFDFEIFEKVGSDCLEELFEDKDGSLVHFELLNHVDFELLDASRYWH